MRISPPGLPHANDRPDARRGAVEDLVLRANCQQVGEHENRLGQQRPVLLRGRLRDARAAQQAFRAVHMGVGLAEEGRPPRRPTIHDPRVPDPRSGYRLIRTESPWAREGTRCRGLGARVLSVEIGDASRSCLEEDFQVESALIAPLDFSPSSVSKYVVRETELLSDLSLGLAQADPEQPAVFNVDHRVDRPDRSAHRHERQTRKRHNGGELIRAARERCRLWPRLLWPHGP
jgi:hypothetical protein